MKTISILAAATLAFLPATLLADGKEDTDWAEKAARGYEEKANWAEKEGMPRAAAIYRRMAEIKREAGRASKHGKKYDWSEYHELEGKLNHIKKEHHLAKKEHHKKDHGNGFLNAADEYRKKAMMARKNGESDKAEIYMKLAEHKVAAARAAKEGKGYDWSDYHELQKKLHGDKPDKGHDKPKHDDKLHHDKPAPAGQLNIE